jgi:hypothetical protein
MTPSTISKNQRKLIARALGNYGTSLLEEVQHGEHPEDECDRLRAMAADTSYLSTQIQTECLISIADLDSIDLELIEAAADSACWRLRRRGTVDSVLAARLLERAVLTIAEQVA